jgi:hypothetical protein
MMPYERRMPITSPIYLTILNPRVCIMVEAPEIKAVNRAVPIVGYVLMMGSGVEETGFGAWGLFPVWRGKRAMFRVEDGGTRCE